MKLIFLITLIVIFFITLVFSVLNFHPVQVNLGFSSITLPLTVALTIELFVGIIIGLLAAFFHIMRLKSEFAQLNKQLKKQSKN